MRQQEARQVRETEVKQKIHRFQSGRLSLRQVVDTYPRTKILDTKTIQRELTIPKNKSRFLF